jgi:16S rRNA (adenine1518-N6/adenine1519-N6)-dimethyltransferase
MMPKAKKSFGQNWLVDQSVITKIIAASDIKTGEHVLEIGPGPGALTRALVGAGARLTAIEADAELVPALEQEFGEKIHLIQGDALQVSLEGVFSDYGYKLIANIPYNITSDILRRYLTQLPRPSRLVLMVQKEVADRMTAQPGEMSFLSVMCQMYAECSRVTKVPAGAFRPIPKVDSAVVRLDIRPDVEHVESVLRIVKAGFLSRRKQLHKNLSSAGVASSKEVKEALEEMGLDARSRAQELSIEMWQKLTHILQKNI